MSNTEEFAKALKKDVRKATSSKPTTGTVIRFTSRRELSAPYAGAPRPTQDYSYAAIYAAGNWYVTDKVNRWPDRIPHAKFIDILAAPDVVKIEVATEFTTL